jgi:hypothetical protein
MKMLNYKTWFLAAVSVLSLLSAVNADVPPDPGFKRVSLKLVVSAQDDFPDYRFFVKSGADLEEIHLKKGEQQTIEPLGGGAWYRAGTFIAVPKKSLADLSELPADGKLSEMQKTVYDGKAEGQIELIKHSFIRDVRKTEASGWKDAVYKIEKDSEKGLKATLVSGGDRENKTADGTGIGLYSREPKSGLFWGTVIGGSLMTLAFMSLGVSYARRSRNISNGI